MAPRRPRKPDPLELLLARVRAVRSDPESKASRQTLAVALTNPRSAVVAAAAQIVGEEQLKDLAPALVTAFDRLMDDPVKGDAMCKGKIAIANALLLLDGGDSAVFLTGIRHQQLEPVFGGRVDTAAELRAVSALGLLRSRHAHASRLVAECLADSEAIARAGAGHALGELNPDAAVPLLWFKLTIGDKDAGVIGACFRSLLDHAPDAAFQLASTWLTRTSDAAAEAIALALGESRKPGAFALLRDYGEQADASGRGVAFVALTLLRDDRATSYLVQLVATGSKDHAGEAVRALANFRHDPRLTEQVLEAARARKDPTLLATAEKAFED